MQVLRKGSRITILHHTLHPSEHNGQLKLVLSCFQFAYHIPTCSELQLLMMKCSNEQGNSQYLNM